MRITGNIKYFYAIAVLAGLYIVTANLMVKQSGQLRTPEEIFQIKATDNLEEQVKQYTKLIQRVGPQQAQEELLHSGLPFTGQTHLLNHVVGDYLYATYGPTGLSQCKEYFLASCYHGFILQAIAEKGNAVLGEVLTACEQEGRPVLVQCAHALGHGFLADVGYKNLISALDRCDNMNKSFSNFPLFNCHDGVFMENIWGVHEGQRSADAWLRPDDPLYPCNDPRINENYLVACWSEQPTFIYQFFHQDLKKVSQVCDSLSNPFYQKACFNALARQIHPLAAGNVEKTGELCALLPLSRQGECIITNAVSGFAVGDRKTPYLLCAQIDLSQKAQCYHELQDTMAAYAKTPLDRREFCDGVLEAVWQKLCYSAP